MKIGFIRRLVVIAASLLFVQTLAASAAGLAKEPSNAATYCTDKGGVVQARLPAYNTNGGNPLILSGQRVFCQFTAKDGSQINVLLSTLATRKPSLAALAYYAEVQMGSCNGNPASCYCSLLGGSDLFGGATGAGGGWVLNTGYTDVLEACIFPDMSSIDSWGLAYHSKGIIRGKNLAKALRYKDPYAPTQRDAEGATSLPY